MSHSHEETEAIRTMVANVAHHIDGKRWAELRALYAETVTTDYTSLFGGTPQKQSGDDLIAGWRGLLGKVATQHLLGPIDVHSTGDAATAGVRLSPASSSTAGDTGATSTKGKSAKTKSQAKHDAHPSGAAPGTGAASGAAAH